MGEFDAARGYAGSAPGQTLSSVLERFTVGDLRILVGERVLPLLPEASRTDKAALVDAALRTVRNRPLAVLGRADTRKTLLRNLDPGKLDELRFRLGKVGVPDVGPDSLTAPGTWPTVSRFLGLDDDETAPSTRPLQREGLRPSFGLFPHQRSVVTRTLARVGAGYGRTLIHMPTGAGKTRTAMHVVCRILNQSGPCVVTWLASSRELLDQAAETFQRAWAALGDREVDLMRFWGDYGGDPDELEDGLLIAGLGKMHAWRSRAPHASLRIGARTRLVVVDEAHQAIAPTYSAVIEGLAEAGQSNAVLGLTATPGRTWNDVGADEELSEFFGGSKIVLEVEGYENPVEYLLAEGYLARPNFSRIVYEPEHTASAAELGRLSKSDDYTDEMLERFAADTARNMAIIQGARDLVAKGHRRVILFAASVSHAEDLSAALGVYRLDSFVVSGETPLAQRAAILKAFKSPSTRPIVLCNFGVLTTGFDAPRTSAAIIARPTKSLVLFSQMVGRATRGVKAGGNETCEVVTVHDPSYPGFGDIAEAFFNWEDVWHER